MRIEEFRSGAMVDQRWGRGTVRERRREECGEVRFASGWLDFI
jgi:hypothetical protein